MSEDSAAQAGGTAPAFDAAYFNTHYRDYTSQNPSWKLDFYLRVLTRYVPARRQAELLDVGCGLGAWLSHLTRHTNWQLAGSDVSDWAIDRNRKELPDVTLSLAGATDQPCPAGSLDVVTALDVLEHVPDRDAAAATIARMLRAGGYFLLVVPVYDGLCGPIVRRLDKDPTHIHKLGRRDWLTWMERHFAVVEWWGVMRYLLPGRFYLHLPTRLARAHTPAILVVARR